ncbi:MAG TPA: hypothetical protein VK619_14685, partial [Pyrinomonadaceae bacterium]|nr:hypothetical protein [Pyrinomonadaceae bacterium]
PEDAGRACLSLDEIKEKLKNWLGPKNHYYFIDACRNTIDEIEFTNLGLKRQRSPLGDPTVYKLFSTAQGNLAKTQSGFTRTLVEGLSGGGIAKDWRGAHLWVIFDRLSQYVKEKIKGQDIDSDREGPEAGLILEIKPIPTLDCEIKVDNAENSDSFTVDVSTNQGSIKQEDFSGASHALKLRPSDYYFTITHPSFSVVQVDPPPSEEPVTVFDPCVVRFEKVAASEADLVPGPPPGDGDSGELAFFQPPPVVTRSARVEVMSAPDSELHLKNLHTGRRAIRRTFFSAKVKPGNYLLKMREKGFTVKSQSLKVSAGQNIKINLLERAPDETRAGILKALSNDPAAGVADFSESLGPTGNWDMGFWLTIMGASRIIAPVGEYQKLAALPLMTFDDVRKGDSPVYVLAGFEKTKGNVRIGLSDGQKVKWRKLPGVKKLPGIFEWREPAPKGPHLLSLKMPGQHPITYAIFCLPNRATFIVLAEDADGQLIMHQYMLPIHKLLKHLDSKPRDYVKKKNQLSLVRTMFLAQNQFARKRPLVNQKGEQNYDLNELIYGKWLDPVMSFIAAYELIRRGISKQRNLLKSMVKNLRRYFPEIPDTEAIAKLIDEKWKMPIGSPLLLDGVLAFDEDVEQHVLPLPPNKVDYGSPWTAWRGAVNDPDSPGESSAKLKSKEGKRRSAKSRKATRKR